MAALRFQYLRLADGGRAGPAREVRRVESQPQPRVRRAASARAGAWGRWRACARARVRARAQCLRRTTLVDVRASIRAAVTTASRRVLCVPPPAKKGPISLSLLPWRVRAGGPRAAAMARPGGPEGPGEPFNLGWETGLGGSGTGRAPFNGADPAELARPNSLRRWGGAGTGWELMRREGGL